MQSWGSGVEMADVQSQEALLTKVPRRGKQEMIPVPCEAARISRLVAGGGVTCRHVVRLPVRSADSLSQRKGVWTPSIFPASRLHEAVFAGGITRSQDRVPGDPIPCWRKLQSQSARLVFRRAAKCHGQHCNIAHTAQETQAHEVPDARCLRVDDVKGGCSIGRGLKEQGTTHSGGDQGNARDANSRHGKGDSSRG